MLNDKIEHTFFFKAEIPDHRLTKYLGDVRIYPKPALLNVIPKRHANGRSASSGSRLFELGTRQVHSGHRLAHEPALSAPYARVRDAGRGSAATSGECSLGPRVDPDDHGNLRAYDPWPGRRRRGKAGRVPKAEFGGEANRGSVKASPTTLRFNSKPACSRLALQTLLLRCGKDQVAR